MASVGTLWVSVKPSLEGFATDLRAQMAALGIDNIKVKVNPETDAAAAAKEGEKAAGAYADAFKARLKAALAAIPDIKLKVDPKEADFELEKIRLKLQALSDKKIGVDINATDAKAELDLIKLKLDELARRSPDIRVKTDAAKAAAEIAALNKEVDRADGRRIEIKTDTSINRIGALTLAIAGIGPALIPIAAVGGAAFASLGAAAAIAGIGIGSIVIAFHGVSAAIKDVDKLDKAILEYGADSTQAVTATKNLDFAMRQLTPAGRDFVTFFTSDIKPVFKQMQEMAQVGLLPGLQDGFRAAKPFLEGLVGLIFEVSRGMGDLAREAGKALSGPFWHQFIDFLALNAVPTIKLFGEAFLHIAQGMAGLSQALFQPVLVPLMNWFKDFAKSVADFGTSAASGKNAGFNAFLGYIKDAAPVVGEFLKALKEAFFEIAKALAGQGLTVLTVLTDFLKVLAVLPPPVLQGLVDVFIFLQAFKLAGSIATGILEIGGALIWLLGILKTITLFLLANPFVALAAAIIAIAILIYTNWGAISDYLSKTWDSIKTIALTIWNAIAGFFIGLWEGIKKVFSTAINWIVEVFKQWYPLILGILSGGILLIPALIVKYWSNIADFFSNLWDTIKSALVAAWNGIVSFFSTIWNFISNIAHIVFDAILQYFSNLWDLHSEFVKRIWNNILSFLSDRWDNIKNVAMTVWNAIASFFVNAWNQFVTRWTNWLDSVKNIFSVVWDFIKNLAITVWNAIADFFINAWDQFTTRWTNFWNATFDWVSNVWNAITSFVSDAWNGLVAFFIQGWADYVTRWTNVWNTVWDFVAGIWNNIVGYIQGKWNEFYGWITGKLQELSDWWARTWTNIKNAAVDIWISIGNGVRNGIQFLIDILNKMIDGINFIITGLSIPPIPHIPPLGGDRIDNSQLTGTTAGLAMGGTIEFGTNLDAIQQMAMGGTVGGGFVTHGPMAVVGEGNPAYPEFVIPTDPMYRGRALSLFDSLGGQLMADGGIIGDLVNTLESSGVNFVASIAGSGSDLILKALDGLKGTFDSMFHSDDNFIEKLAHGGGDWVFDHLRKLVETAIEAIKAMQNAIGNGTGDMAGRDLTGALAWAKTQEGKPYIWGGVGPAGFDCSGFMSAIVNVIHGGSPNSRLFATGSIGSYGGLTPSVGYSGSTFEIGSTPNAGGGIGHMAGTLQGVNVESGSGHGPMVGNRALGSRSGLFTQHYQLADAGALLTGIGGIAKLTSDPERVLSPQQTLDFHRLVDWLAGSKLPSGQTDLDRTIFGGGTGGVEKRLDNIYHMLKTRGAGATMNIQGTSDPGETARAAALQLRMA